MASTSSSKLENSPLRPFLCDECGGAYTRQEHLDRHIAAKHRASKEFVCRVCNKGFARRDIQKRHELAHAKERPGEDLQDVPKPPPAPRTKRTAPATSVPTQLSKVMRISRACNRCSKSKLRCDGEATCSRCAKQEVECRYDRPWSSNTSLPISFSNQPSNLPSSSSSQSGSPSGDSGGSGDEDVKPEWEPPRSTTATTPYGGGSPAAYPRAFGATPPVDPWNRPTPPMSVASLSPYSVPIQQSSFPPSHFQHHPGALAYQYPHSRLPPTYGHPSQFPSSQLPAFPSQSAIPSLNSSPQHAAGPSTWDGGRPSASNDPSGSDFLDLIAKSTSSMELELDWDLLNQGYNPRLGDGGTGFTPREGNSPRADADLDSTLDSLENGQDHPHPQSEMVAPSLHIEQSNSPAPTYSATLPSQFEDALTVQDSAAESLLRLASHTPRESPEPQQDPALADSEDKPRSSHPSHSPSNDPWPLSYRPSPGPEVILPSGRSRAASPMREYDEVPVVVPRLTDSTRDRILANVREVATDHFDRSERFIPPLELLNLFLQLFFSRYQVLLPLIHTPTFDPNDGRTTPSFLLLAAAAIGARYAWDIVSGAAMWAHALSETARRMLQTVGDVDNSTISTVPWQQCLLLLLHAGLISGSKRDLERTQAFNGMPTTFCRRQGWLKELPVDEGYEASLPLDERWRRWRDREEIKRLGFGTLMLGGMGVAMWDFEHSYLYVDAAGTSLPCNDQLWEAPSATSWAGLFRGSSLPARGVETLAAINQVSDRSLHSSDGLLAAARDGFAMAVVLTVLHVIGASKLRETHSTSLFLPAAVQFDKPFSPVQAALDAGLEFFQARVVLPPELQNADSSASKNSMALMLHLTAMCQRLPLRILQVVARASTSSPTADVNAWVHSWAAEDDGKVARRTAWEAAQLLAIVGSTPTDAPLEPFALTYAALALLCFATAPISIPVGGHGEEDLGGAIRLDKLVDSSDPELAQWIATGRGAPVLEGIGDLLSVDGAEKLLRLCGARLSSLQVWKVGEQFGGTLFQLADGIARAKGE